MKHRVLAMGAALAVLATAACGGHGGNATPPMNQNQPQFTGPQSFAWGKSELDGANLLGPASVSHMQAMVVMDAPGARALATYAQQVSDPKSPLYRHYLTPQEIGSRFGAGTPEYQKVADYFVAHGLHVAGWPQHLSLSVAGSQSAMESAFGTKFGLYEKDGRQFVAPMSTPRFSAVLPVSGVENLVALHRLHTYYIKVPPRAGNGVTIGYSPQQVRNAFDFSGAYKAGYDGTGITVGIIGTGPINVVSRTTWCGDADVAALRSLYNNVSAGKVCEVNVTPTGVTAGLAASGIPTAAPATPNPLGTPAPNPGQSPTSMFPYSGDFQTPPPVTDTCTGSLPACNPEDSEAQLDTQQVATLAPGANVNFYLAYNASDCYVFYSNGCASPAPSPSPKNSNYGEPQIGLVEADAEIQQAIADNTADVISLSYGLGEPQNVDSMFNSAGVGFGPEELAALASEGIAVFVSSGDNGAASCLGNSTYLAQVCVSYPSGDVSVTSVGGVNAPINEFGQLTDNLTAWGTTTSLGTMGSGGGVSTIFQAPSWQQQALGATMRTQPDVSMIGDPLTGVTYAVNSGFADAGYGAIGGTSVAAPQMAAMWALVLQACQASATCNTAPYAKSYRLGNAAPYLYAIYAPVKAPFNGFAPHLSYAQTFYDVLYGSNAMVNPSPPPGGATPIPGAKAMTGYDQVTGVGVPFAGHLIQAITGKAAP